MIEGKGLGNKKINRVNLSLTNEYDSKLRRLATSCRMKHTELARIILEMCLDNADFVDSLQKEHCTQSAYRIMLVRDIQGDGELHYMLAGREDL